MHTRTGGPFTRGRRRMPVCRIDHCENEATRKGRQMCEMHYYRERRGTPMNKPKLERNNTGRCAVDGCLKAPRGFLCAMHEARRYRHGDVTVKLNPGTPGGPGHHSWVGDDAGYNAVHLRLGNHRGHPSTCEICGTEEPRRYHWAIDWRRDPPARCDLLGNRSPYSVELADYVRACVPCHKKMDLASIAKHQDGREG